MTASNLTLLLACQSLGRYFSKFAVLLPQPRHNFINPIRMRLSVTWVTDAFFFIDYESYFKGGEILHRAFHKGGNNEKVCHPDFRAS